MSTLGVLLIERCCVSWERSKVFKAQLGINGNTMLLDG